FCIRRVLRRIRGMRGGTTLARHTSNFRSWSRCRGLVAALYSVDHSRPRLVLRREAWLSFLARMEGVLFGHGFSAGGLHLGLGCIVDRRNRSSNFCAFLAPRSSPGACSERNSIFGHQPPSWDRRFCCLCKGGGFSDAAVVLRSVNGFF